MTHSSSPPLRLRFAPSPTGYLHIGGARTALFCWLWARKQQGAFVLRIEDTDQARNTPESLSAIIDSMRWLGLDWDEGPEVGGDHGPYFQSKRRELYREYAERLIRTGHAYRCYATREELDEARERHKATGSRDPFRYPGIWRDRSDHPPDKPYVVRFKSPQSGSTGWVDKVKGRIDVPNNTQQDFVILRSDGLPLYNFACVVDDMLMGINLVARGDDHVVNTAPQILIYEALGKPVPEFAHVPMILAPNGEKLSKRHAAVSVLEYRDAGYLPDGVVNYLARLGWSHGDQEIFTREQLLTHFDWAQVGRNPARYDAKKFTHVQGEHLRMQSPEQVATQSLPFLASRELHVDAQHPSLVPAITAVLTRATTLAEVAEGIDYVFRDPPELDPKAARKFLIPAKASLLRALKTIVEEAPSFDAATLESRVNDWLAQDNLPLKEIAQPARVALTGRTRSPGLYELMLMLGRDTVLKRLSAGAEHAERNDGNDAS